MRTVYRISFLSQPYISPSSMRLPELSALPAVEVAVAVVAAVAVEVVVAVVAAVAVEAAVEVVAEAAELL